MMKYLYLFLLLVLSISPVFSQKSIDKLKINQIQVLGTHNSYARPVDPALLEYGDAAFGKLMGSYLKNMAPEQQAFYKEYHPNEVPMSEGLKYLHPSFPEQLDAGLRSLEIDIYYDPTGNRFNDPAGHRLLKSMNKEVSDFDTTGLGNPGFKVMHIADFDFRTHYPTLKEALQSLKKWSDGNPGHIPIYIMIEAKDTGIPIFPDPAPVLPFDEKAFDELDHEIVSIIGRDKIITPDDVRQDYSTLREAVLANNWPTVKEARGKFIFLMLPGSAGNSRNQAYVKNHPNLENRVIFMQAVNPDEPFAAFLLLDNAIVRQKEIREAVKAGYLVRTRSDIETYEAKTNDYTRAKAAFSSGAQVISTDFFRKGNTYGTDYYVTLPGKGEAIANPVNGKP
ncbi:MAG: phosphatidylinositol-specific phospholipase C1-like protein [Leadbetterella sp.]|nr:phosphatidylinositol-specific phospholipase C1-like protein [Leadbetterella sp.]